MFTYTHKNKNIFLRGLTHIALFDLHSGSVVADFGQGQCSLLYGVEEFGHCELPVMLINLAPCLEFIIFHKIVHRLNKVLQNNIREG